MNDEQYYAAIQELDDEDDIIEHHGILGMKWGIRRYQNPDGSLTELGKKHYEDGSGRTQKVIEKWNEKKEIAIAKGDTDFARKNIDYLSNNDLERFKQRIVARTSLDDLKQASRRITADKLQSWSNMMASGANLLGDGIRAYNNAATIINAITKKQTIPPLKQPQGEGKKKDKNKGNNNNNGGGNNQS